MAIRAGTRFFLLAALAALATPARAQEQGESRLISTPAETFAMTPGGVDMRTGRYAYSETDLTIGGEGSQGLTLARTMTQPVNGHVNPFANLSHNWDIMVSERRINIDQPSAPGTDYRIMVHYGGRSQTFEARVTAGWGFGQKSVGGFATLTYAGNKADASVVYTYTAPDGTVAVFRALGLPGYGDCSSASNRRCAFASQITEPDGTVYTFDYVPSGSPAGGSQRLARVTSSRGYALLLEGSGNRVTKACVLNLSLGPVPADGLCPANAAATSSYAYSSDGAFPVATYRIVGATGPDNATSGFSYGASTMAFVRPGESEPWLINGTTIQTDEEGIGQDVIGNQRFADGGSYDYTYGQAPFTNTNPYPAMVGGSYVNALGERMEMPYEWPLLHTPGNPGSSCYPQICPLDMPDGFTNWIYQQTPGPVRITDALGRTTTLNYCDPGPLANLPPQELNRCVVVPLVSFTDPEGARTELQYDGHRNVSRVTRHPRPGSVQPNGQPWPPIVTSAVYDTGNRRSASKPLSMTDARGNTTTYTYAPEHGGLLTMTGPIPSPGAPRPQIRHSYTARQARLWDGSPAGPSVWLRTSTSLCRTSAATGDTSAPCATAGDEVRTTFDYGPETEPNTLLLRGQAVTPTDNGASTILRTCYAYDARGRRISETQPAARLPSCPAGPPTGPLPYTSSTRYDAGGRVTGTISADPDPLSGGGSGPLPFLAVRNSYDQAGRLLKVETGTLASWQSEAVAPSDWTGFSVVRRDSI